MPSGGYVFFCAWISCVAEVCNFRMNCCRAARPWTNFVFSQSRPAPPAAGARRKTGRRRLAIRCRFTPARKQALQTHRWNAGFAGLSWDVVLRPRWSYCRFARPPKNYQTSSRRNWTDWRRWGSSQLIGGKGWRFPGSESGPFTADRGRGESPGSARLAQ